ncbi:hypothetical protein ACTFIR_005784 [Dictyostelium discoideum]
MKLMSHLLHKANNHNYQLTTNTTTDSSVTAAVTTTNNNNNNNQQPTTNNNNQQPTTNNNNQQQPTTTTNEITNYPKKNETIALSYIQRRIICRFISLYYTERIVSFSGSEVVDSETSISGGGGGPVKPKPIQKVIRNLGSNKFSLDRVSSIISKFPTSEELASIHKLHSMK